MSDDARTTEEPRRARRPRPPSRRDRAGVGREDDLLAGLGAHARDRVRRPQRRPRRQGLRVVLPARDRGRRVHAARTRASIFETLTTRLGVRGQSLELAKSAFQSSDDVKKATGYLGLLLTFFFASAFTTALQRVYLRSWRRPPGMKVGSYTRGLIWLLALLANMTAHRGARPGARQRARPRALHHHLAGAVGRPGGGSRPGTCCSARSAGGRCCRPRSSPRWR